MFVAFSLVLISLRDVVSNDLEDFIKRVFPNITRLSFVKGMNISFCLFCRSETISLPGSDHVMPGVAIYLCKSSSGILTSNVERTRFEPMGELFRGIQILNK